MQYNNVYRGNNFHQLRRLSSFRRYGEILFTKIVRYIRDIIQNMAVTIFLRVEIFRNFILISSNRLSRFKTINYRLIVFLATIYEKNVNVTAIY